MRGGNTIVTDIECLRTYPNSSPQINDVELRRGDSIWVTLNQCLGGKLVGFEKKRVVMTLPLFLTQERASSPKLKLLSNSFAADIQGGAFVRAFSNLLKRKLKNTVGHGSGIIGTVLRFSEEDCKNVTKETIENIESRQTILKMNAWRISGLISAIRYQINNTLQENPTITTQKESMEDLRKMLDWVEQGMSISAVNEFCQRLNTGLAEGVAEFMLELDISREQYSSSLPLRARDEQKRMAIQFISKCVNASSLRLVGEGQEGIVYTDGQKAYKYFISNISQVKNATRELIKTKLNSTSELKRIVAVEKLVVEKNEMLVVMPFIEGPPYNGGGLIELLELLRECKRAGIALTNLCPENLIVGKNGPVYIDIGRSVVPYQESLFIQMCKRAYLIFRWHYRTDLKELLTRSLHETDLAELFGFDEFMKALNQMDIHRQMDSLITELCLKTGAKKVLDFGCGSGSLADKLAKRGLRVDCYDPNEYRFLRHSHEPTVRLVKMAELNPNFNSGTSYDLVLCSLVLCSIESEKEVEQALSEMRQLVTSNGKVIISICNPFAVGVHTSPSQIRQNSCDSKYNASFPISKSVFPACGQREDHHRPLNWYVQAARNANLDIKEVLEVPSVDVERLSPSSDQVILVFQPLEIPPRNRSVSLVIKACAMEWQTIEKQIRHIVWQLEGPQKFAEKVLLTDAATESFARPYASTNWEKFKQAIQNLLEDGVIDRIIEAPLREEEIRRVNLRWFGLYCAQPKAANGQPTYTTLYGFEKCRGEYVLQLDSDCIIHRASRNHDYLGEILSVFEKDPLAVIVSVPIAHKNKQPFRRERNGKSFRVETRCSLLDLRRLQSLLPLTNEVDSGVLKLPWHRSLDIAVSEGRATSYRGGNPQTCFIHIPNSRKSDINGWINTIDCIEHGTLLKEQMGNVELVGQTADWIGRRNEEMVLILRGKDVPISKIRRSLQSLQRQCFQKWSAVIVDAGSSNGTNDFCQFVIRCSFGNRVSFVSNHIAVTPMENIDFVASEVCTNPMSIIAHLDLDDALIGGNALDKIDEAYRNGADVTVGSVLRTDKQAKYLVSFEDPRANRGGNVWQHLRTYRKYLYDKVPKDYFKINGEWVPHTEDWAFMIPIVELAKSPMNIKDVIYFYEPSEQKMCRTIKEREQIVAKLIAKPKLEAQD